MHNVAIPASSCRRQHPVEMGCKSRSYLLVPEGVLQSRQKHTCNTKGICFLIFFFRPIKKTPNQNTKQMSTHTHNYYLQDYVPEASQNMDEKSVTPLTFHPLISALNFSLKPKTLRNEVTLRKSQLPITPCSRETPSGSRVHC